MTKVGLETHENELLRHCEDALNNQIVVVDVTFGDGTSLTGVRIDGGAMLLPDEYSQQAILQISVPLEQGAAVRSRGHALTIDRAGNRIVMGPTLMTWMMKQ
jgi:hypothetical protein